MNRIFVMLIFLMACSQSKDTQQTTVSDDTAALPEGLPAGATLESFADESGITKVTVKDNTGAILQEGILKEGKREGNWTEYHPEGFVKSVTPYVNDQKEGVYLEITMNGQLSKRFFYHNNLKNGEYREYQYSTIKEQRVYVNDKLEGLAKIFYDNGKIMEEGNYKNGTRDGVSRWYDQEGKVTIEYEYKEGQLVKK